MRGTETLCPLDIDILCKSMAAETDIINLSVMQAFSDTQEETDSLLCFLSRVFVHRSHSEGFTATVIAIVE